MIHIYRRTCDRYLVYTDVTKQFLKKDLKPLSSYYFSEEELRTLIANLSLPRTRWVNSLLMRSSIKESEPTYSVPHISDLDELPQLYPEDFI